MLSKITSFLLVLLLTIVPVARPASAQEIVIGEVASLSGRFAKPGGSIHEGVETAVHQINLAGGVGGHPVRLVTRDDGGDPQKAIEAAESLCLKEKVIALTGGYVDSLVGPVAEVAEKYKVPYVAAASLQSKLTQLNRKYFFRISNLEGYVNPMTQLIGSIGAESVAVVHSTTPGATELAALLTKHAGSGGISIIAVETFKPGTSDFTPMLLKTTREGPDILISLGFFQDNLLMVKQMKENGISPGLFIGAFGLEYQALIDDLGADTDYLVGTTAWEEGINVAGTEKMATAYLSAFRDKFGREPEPLTMHGYSSAMVIIDALDRLIGSGATPGREALSGFIRQTDLPLPMERIKFDDSGEPLYYTRYIFQIKNGRRMVIFPPEAATSRVEFPAPPWDKR